MIKQIGLPLRGRPILLITRMITDRIGLHSVLLPLPIIWNIRHTIKSTFLGCAGELTTSLRGTLLKTGPLRFGLENQFSLNFAHEYILVQK